MSMPAAEGPAMAGKVALVTGGRRGYDEFTPLARRLAAQGYRVVLHDRRKSAHETIS